MEAPLTPIANQFHRIGVVRPFRFNSNWLGELRRVVRPRPTMHAQVDSLEFFKLELSMNTRRVHRPRGLDLCDQQFV